MEESSFKSAKSRRLFEFLKDAYLKDDEVLRVPLEKCGWRSLVQIAEGTGFAVNTLYGKRPGRLPADLQDLISGGQIEKRYFGGERGRGGEVMRFRVIHPRAQNRKQTPPVDVIEQQAIPAPITGISHREKKQFAQEERRHLATIMFTDIVGYTALGQKDESFSFALIKECSKLLRPIFERHGGTVVKTIGDAFLIQFPDALSGVRCGYDIQRVVREFNIVLPAEKRFSLRIGLHLGDVIESGGDIFGDAVNIASRVESLAESGGVCLTRQVYDQVRNKIDLTFSSLGERLLKNVELPIEVYKIKFPSFDGGTESKKEEIDSRRIAVLPFANMSPDSTDSYFADGVTEEIISTISKIPALTVISRTSSMKYKNSDKSANEIGRELRAGKILEGSVRKAGNKVRIATQLIDSINDIHLWTESYDKDLEDIFAIQSEIAQRVADALEIRLLSKEKREIENGLPTKSKEAYTLFLKGRFYLNERSREGVDKAVKYFEKAIELDPRFALAFGALADCYVVYSDYAWLLPRESFELVKEYSMEAIKLDPRLAEPHASLGIALANYEYNWNEGEKELQRAIELNPSYATAYHWLSLNLRSEGRLAESYACIRRAHELDPLSQVIELNVGEVLLYAGKTNEAIAIFERVLEENPDYAFCYMWLGWGYFMASLTDKAIETIRKTIVLSHGDQLYKAHLACLLGLVGKREEANELLEELIALNSISHVDSGHLAYALFGTGRKDEAFAYLEKAYQERSYIIPYLSWWPWFREMKRDQKFVEFMKKVGLQVT